jgi:sugar phosphate permease
MKADMKANIAPNVAPLQTTLQGFARYAPWLMAFLALFMLFVTNGFTTTSLTAYDESLLKEFGWTRGQLKFRDLITLMIAGLSAPFAGILIDKIGVRKLMLTGSLLLAAAYFSYGFITSLTHLYIIHAVFGVVLVCAGLNVAVIHVSQWFHSQRGTGIGIALVGSSLGGALLTPIMVKVVAMLGWRETFMWMSALAIVLFFVCLFASRSPAYWGVAPLTAAPSAGGGAPKNAGATPYDFGASNGYGQFLGACGDCHGHLLFLTSTSSAFVFAPAGIRHDATKSRGGY